MEPGDDILASTGETRVHLVEHYKARQTSNDTSPNEDNDTIAGLTTTQIVIVFLIFVFALIILFLLLYYCTTRSSKQRSIRRQVEAQKSISSSSVYDEKPQTIFDHPERQLAVDQSVRTDPNSPASINQSSDPEVSSPSSQNQSAPQAVNQKTLNTETSPAPAKTVPKYQDSPPTRFPQEQQVSSSPKLPLKPAEKILVKEVVAPRKPKTPPRKKERSKSFESSENHTMIGTLANLRDTLKESDADS